MENKEANPFQAVKWLIRVAPANPPQPLPGGERRTVNCSLLGGVRGGSVENPSRQPVELRRELEILFRQAARIVRREGEGDLVPANINVGMMPRLFCKLRNGIDELYRHREILELKGARDGRAFLFPIRHALERSFGLGSVKFCHA